MYTNYELQKERNKGWINGISGKNENITKNRSSGPLTLDSTVEIATQNKKLRKQRKYNSFTYKYKQGYALKINTQSKNEDLNETKKNQG